MFDFGVIARLNQVKVVSTEDLRKVVRVKIEVTNSLPYFNYVTEKGIPPNQIVTLDSAVQARYAKLTVIAEAEKNPGVLPIGLSKYVVVLCVFTIVCTCLSDVLQNKIYKEKSKFIKKDEI